jgi:prepilin-type N-terminal cleavage/methylation domain-containing protein
LGFLFSPRRYFLFLQKRYDYQNLYIKEEAMGRLAFTMIELIFVIVILGILAAIALPRFGNVHDDAQIAVEKSGIGSARSALNAVRGKAFNKVGKEVNISVIDKNGLFYAAVYQPNTLVAADQEDEADISVTNYPNALSFSGWSAGGASQSSATPVSVGFVSAENGEKGSTALAIVLEPGGRDDFSTFATPPHSGYTPAAISGGTLSYITGRASKVVTDPSADPCYGKFWVYNSLAGTISIAGACIH